MLELGEHPALEQPRRDVDLDVELPQLGLKRLVGDRLEGDGVDERRVAVVVGQVQLDLETERPLLWMKARLRQHPREHIEAQPHLAPVALAVLPAEGPGGDLLTHAHSIRRQRRDVQVPAAAGPVYPAGNR